MNTCFSATHAARLPFAPSSSRLRLSVVRFLLSLPRCCAVTVLFIWKEAHSLGMDSRSRSPGRVDRHRDREKLRPAPYRKDDYFGSKPGGNRSPPFNRVFVSNIPYEEKWQGIKDLFRDKVGEVTYVELITDESGNSKGFGIIEFKTKELAQKAVEKMSGYEIRDRKLVTKEDFHGDFLQKALRRISQQQMPRNAQMDRNGGRYTMPMPPPMQMPGMPPPMPRQGPIPPLSHRDMGGGHREAPASSVEQKIQEITGGVPLGDTIFIANLDYSVSYSKLKEVFSLAGKVVKIDLQLDKDNKSRGMATVTFESPMEALQAITMFNKQLLYDRPMLVKMDRNSGQPEKKPLPSGLQSIGPSLDIASLNRGDDYEAHSMRRMEQQSSRNDAAAELDLLTKTKKLLESQLGVNLSSLNSGVSSRHGNLSGIPGLLKPSLPSDGLSSLGQQVGTSSALRNLGLAQVAALGALGGGNRSTDRIGGGSQYYQNQIGDIGSSVLPRLGISDRERIDLDIARVDDRIRDLDRSLQSVNDRAPLQGHHRAGMSSHGTMVMVSNLPFTMTWQELKQRFSGIGNVNFATVKMENGRSKGFGCVRYDTPEEAMMAFQHLNGLVIDGRRIDVKLGDDRNGGGSLRR